MKGQGNRRYQKYAGVNCRPFYFDIVNPSVSDLYTLINITEPKNPRLTKYTSAVFHISVRDFFKGD